MRTHLIIDLNTGLVELHTDTTPKPPKAVRGKDQRKRKRKARATAKAVKVGTSVTKVREGDLIE